MFVGVIDILGLIGELTGRRAQFFHACNFLEFESYLALGGVPSRNLMSNRGLPFTRFDSDAKDRSTGNWSKVFLNMTDFGRIFHMPKEVIPNPYGPILLVLNADCIEHATDVAICLRSAGERDFDRAKESLRTLEEVTQLFTNPSGTAGANFLKTTPDLKRVFGAVREVKSSPEVSCSMKGEVVSLDYVAKIAVDPLCAGGRNLLEEVTASATAHHKVLGKMVERSPVHPYFQRLVDQVASGVRSLRELADDPQLGAWAQSCQEKGLDWLFNRYARYLAEGTISKLVSPPSSQGQSA